jgi:Domain of unknown function (DUF5597)/Beta-galactosidase
MRRLSGKSSWAIAAAVMLVFIEGCLTAAPGVAQAAAPRKAERKSLPAPGKSNPIPEIVEKDGRFALMVDGRPYLMLGVQANNSSAWPDYLGKVWPAAEMLHANTVELPIYWEQIEESQGKFDFSMVDLILKQAREHKLRLVLLWFGTWKNGSSHYTPEWVKTDQVGYPFLRGKDGQTVDSPSTFSSARLEADKTAFRMLMRHLKNADPQRTVIMVQVENEAGVWGAARDYGPDAEKAFEGEVPEQLLKSVYHGPGTWRKVFGEDADETFQAWCTATYIEEVAAAGKAEYALPLYVNAALRDPIRPGKPPSYESGGPTDNEIGLWKAAAPSIQAEAPDIYLAEYPKYMKVMDLYKRDDNPLLIPETGNSPAFARYVFAAIGHGAIGWAPFGLDLSRYSNQSDGPGEMEPDALKPVAQQYALLAPVARMLAQLSFDGKLQGVSEDPENHRQTLKFEHWRATVSYGLPSVGNWVQPKGNSPVDGGVLVAELGPDEFLVAGHHARVDFTPSSGEGKRLFLKVEEGSYDQRGDWKTARVWNGDQTDWGLNLSAEVDYLLKVRLTTF